MKILVVSLLSIVFLFSDADLNKVRAQFPNIASEEQADAFIAILNDHNTAEAKGYIAAMNFMKSRFVSFPFTKLKYFKIGKKQLDEVIDNNPANIEMRYIRYLMQKEIPQFLGYHENINEDFKLILNGIESSDLERSFKIKMLGNMLMVSNLTSEEENELTKLNKNL